MDWLEIFGYIGSIVTAASLMMSNIKKLRWWNLTGAAIFTIYGALIGAYPVFLLNGWIVLTNIYYLKKMYQFQDQFDALYFPNGDSSLSNMLGENYAEDIVKFFPNYAQEWLANPSIVICRNMHPVGLFIFTPPDNGISEVLVDYATPEVRDRKNTEFLFTKRLHLLKDIGITTLIAQTDLPDHQEFLRAVGFKHKSDTYYERALD